MSNSSLFHSFFDSFQRINLKPFLVNIQGGRHATLTYLPHTRYDETKQKMCITTDNYEMPEDAFLPPEIC